MSTPAEPMRPQYVGRHEIGVLLGRAGHEQIYQAITSSDFPAPTAVLSTGEVWLEADVEDWIQRHDAG